MAIDTRLSVANDCSVPPEKVFVKLSESETNWFVYNERGLFAIPARDAQTVRYQNCPALRTRG